MKRKKIAVLFLTMALSVGNKAEAEGLDIKDMPENWSRPYIEYALENNLLKGSGGYIRPNESLTRSELATIVNRILDNSQKADISGYKDMDPSKWYYSEMEKAVASGIFKGSNGKLNPEAAISRQEAFLVMARVFELEKDGRLARKTYNDGDKIALWAEKEINALTDMAYIKGDKNNRLRPLDNISRAEYAALVKNLLGEYLAGGRSIKSKIVTGNVLVNNSDSIIKDVNIKGDLILTEGLKGKKLELEGLRVEGRIIIREGMDLNLVDTRLGLVENLAKNTRIKLDGESRAENLITRERLILEGKGKIKEIKLLKGSDSSKIQVEYDDLRIDKSVKNIEQDRKNIDAKEEQKEDKKKTTSKSKSSSRDRSRDKEKSDIKKKEKEQKDKEQREKEQREKEQREKEQREKEQKEKEQKEKEQKEKEQKEKEQKDKEQKEKEQKDKEQKDKEQKEKEQREKEQREKEQKEKEQKEKEQREKEQREKEQKEKEQREKEEKEKEQKDKEQKEQEQKEQEQKEQEQKEQEQKEKEQREKEQREKEEKEKEQKEKEQKEQEQEDKHEYLDKESTIDEKKYIKLISSDSELEKMFDKTLINYPKKISFKVEKEYFKTLVSGSSMSPKIGDTFQKVNKKDRLKYTNNQISIQTMPYYPTDKEIEINIDIFYPDLNMGNVEADKLRNYDRKAAEVADKFVRDEIEGKGLRDEEKVLAINNFLVLRAEYNHQGLIRYNIEDHIPYGVLVNKKGVCESYAKAFQLIAEKSGLESVYVTGKGYNGSNSSGEDHAWNMVKINGEWYNIDTTWNDIGGEDIRYDYFLRSDKIMGRSHIRDQEIDYPQANGRENFREKLNLK